MSVEIPANMEEVAMKIAAAKVHGQDLAVDDVIRDAVRDTMQAMMDEALEGHYDDVSWSGNELVVTDFTGKQVGTVAPAADNFISDFRENADQLSLKLEKAAAKIVGGR
ncbi:hypothetical protein [uncultured Limosilactobacillus sp.]|uniref:hypothetical protein n=1 Tax=uncultured Limosilactobacillus sp. TaxID=2837629 RepID=UPI0025FD3C22|nr:hypothetical protein [uncultured Limosilactobacillus sp.]